MQIEKKKERETTLNTTTKNNLCQILVMYIYVFIFFPPKGEHAIHSDLNFLFTFTVSEKSSYANLHSLHNYFELWNCG